MHVVSRYISRGFRFGVSSNTRHPCYVPHCSLNAPDARRSPAGIVRADARRTGISFLAAICVALVSLAAAGTKAANIATTQSGNWEAGTTWVGGVPPGSGDNVTIASGHLVAVPVDAAAATINISANTSGTNGITIASGIRLSVGGAITMTAPTAGTSTMNVGAGTLNSASITIPGSGTAGRNCVVTVSTGTITVTGSIAFTGTAAQAQFVSTDASTVNIGGNFESGGTLTTTGTGTINFNGSTAQTIGTYTTYNNVSINNTSGGVTLAGTTTIGGVLTVASGTFTVGPYTLTVSGATSVSGTLNITSATGAKTFTGNVTINNGGLWNNSLGNVAVSMGGSLQNDGTFSAGTGAYTFTGAAKTIGGASAVSIPNLTVNGTVTNNGTLTVSAALAGTGTLTNDVNATLSLGGTFTITTLTSSANPNTVNYSGAAQTARVQTYHHLTLSGSGVKTLTNIGTINGNLTLSGTCSATTAIATVIGGNLTVGTGTTFTVAGFNLTVTGTTSVTGTLAHSSATGTKTYGGLVTINSGGVWTNAGNSAFTLRGGLTHNGTTFSSGTGVYTFDTNAQALGGTSAFTIGSVTVTGITLTNNATNFTVSTALSGTGELLQGTGAQLSIASALTITTLTATANPNTVNYSGAAQTVRVIIYHHLSLSGSGVKTITNVGTINGNLTLSGTCSATTAIATVIGANLTVGTGTTFTVAGFDLIVTGTTSVSGTLAHSSATGTKIHTGLVTINSGGAWTNTGNSAFTFQGGLTHNGTTFTSGTGVYAFDTNPQTIEGGSALSINNVTVTGITLTNNLTNFSVSTALSGTGELFQGTAAMLNIGGTSGITNLTATVYPNTVNYCGTVQTIKAVAYHHLTLSGSGAKTMPPSTLTVNGDFTLSGTASAAAAAAINIAGSFTIGSGASFAAGSFTHDLKGAFTNNNIFTSSGSNITLTGATDQAIGGSATTTFDNLTVNKVNGAVTVSRTFNVSGTLDFNSGIINTGANTVSITSTGSVLRTTGHVIGNLRKHISAGSPSATFEIGAASSYCPLSVSFSGITSSGDLTASVTSGDHPNIASSTIEPVRSVNKYWTLTSSGITFTNYDATFGFSAGDLDAGVNVNLFKVGRYAAGTWSYPSVGLKTATSIGATALAGFSDFCVGEDIPFRPVLASIDSQSVLEGDTLVVGISATDPDNDSLTLSAVNLPTHACLSDNGNGTGSLHFWPSFTQAGIYNITVLASNGALADSEVVTITVTDVNVAPVLASIGSQLVPEGDTLIINISATDPGGDSLILSAINLPTNASFSDNGNMTGVLHFNPAFAQAGAYFATFIVSDGLLADSETVSITVVLPDSVTICGDAGVADAILSYVDNNVLKSATADGSGIYSISVPYNWSGTITPSKAGYVFAPGNRTYLNVLANQIDQNYSVSLILDVGQDLDNFIPDEFRLAQNYPNPFNPTTVIEYSVPRRSHIMIEIFSILGQAVRVLVDEEIPAGNYQSLWNGNDNNGQTVSSGVYLYRITAGSFTQSRKMLLLR